MLGGAVSPLPGSFGGSEPNTALVDAASGAEVDARLASDIYKADVYDNAEDKIGVVTDLIVDNSGGPSRRQLLASAIYSASARRTWQFLSKA